MADLTEITATQSVKIIGSDLTGQENFPVTADSLGNLLVISGKRISYSAGLVGLVPGAAATDVINISGSATKTIRVTRIEITMTTTSGTGGAVNLSLIKRSTANSAGTSTTQTSVPHDSTNAAGTAVVKAYTANPTLGTSVGVVRAFRYAINGANSIIHNPWTFGDQSGQEIILRGVAESLSLNFNGTILTGSSVSFDIEWTEE